MRYLGTSSERASFLLVAGWDCALPYTDLREARLQAHAHALSDGGRAVVLSVSGVALESDVLAPEHLEVCEVLPEGAPVSERLGLPETAGLGDVLSGLLDALKVAHNHVVHAVHVGKGEGDAGVSSTFKEFDRDHPVRSLVGLPSRDWERKQRELERKQGAAGRRGGVPDLRAIRRAAKGSKFTARLRSKVRAIHGAFRKLHTHYDRFKRMMRDDNSQTSGPGVGQKPGGAGQTSGPGPKTGKAPKAPKAGAAPHAPKAGKAPGGAKPKPGASQMKVARKTVTIKCRVNGVATTTTVKKGSRYRLEKSPKGLLLKRRGGHGTVVVSAGDAAKLG